MSRRFDIRAYMEEHLVRFHTSAGSELTGVCPSPTCRRYGGFYVNADSGAYLCNKCGLAGRRVASLVAIIEDISEAEANAFIFRQSVEMRRRETTITLVERLHAIRPHAARQEVTPVAFVDDALPDGFRSCYASKAGKDVWLLPAYLKERGIKSATARAWGMGFVDKSARHSRDCPGWERGQKCAPLCSRRYAGRLIIPVDCPNGRSHTARDMLGDQFPKYLNPTGTDFRRLLIGWNLARLTGDIVLCEGPLDAVKLYQHAISALSLGGKELHDEQMSMLMALPTSTAVTIMLDPEEVEAPLKVATRLSVHFTDVYVATLEPIDGPGDRGKLDPGNSTSKEAYTAIDNAVRWTGRRLPRLQAKLLSAKRATASRWS